MKTKSFMNILCHLLYFLGDGWSRLILRFDCMGWTYLVYNKLMCWSVFINDKYDLTVWETIPNEH